MPCTIKLRHDQSPEDVKSSSNSSVQIFSQRWVKEEALRILQPKLAGISFNIVSGHGKDSAKIIDTFTGDGLDLVKLQKIARAEAHNCSGVIKFSQYEPDISDRGVIIAMRDLVRQCVIVGKDWTTHYGGYGMALKSQKDSVYICDLAGLQFQHHHNTGRLVLVCEQESKFSKLGTLDSLIFKEVVGEAKANYRDIAEKLANPDLVMRYLPRQSATFGKCFFDVKAYKRFVEGDVYLAAVALSSLAAKNGDKLNFKFLKYGTGFFAQEFGELVNRYILDGVISGLENVFECNPDLGKTIRHLEFPFYGNPTPSEKLRLDRLTSKFALQGYKFSKDDDLATTVTGLITATTNCGDPHAVFGNEMGYSSVDAAIATNLKSSGNIFCPNLNKKIK